MVSQEACGMAFVAFHGVAFSGQLAMGKVLKDMGWPSYRMSAFCKLLLAACYAAGLGWQRAKLPAAGLWKWAALRGFFGALNAVTSAVAVQIGTPMGDVAALTSINTVITALFGHVFLGERLRWPHYIALLSSVVGAVLIARPQFLFGQPPGTAAGGNVWLGYVLAVASGFLIACMLIASRKSGDVSVWVLTFSVSIQSGIIEAALPLARLVEDFTLEPLAASPEAASYWLAALFTSILAGTVMISMGSRLCPVAVSATLGTSVRMVCGYLVQTVLFGVSPEAITLAGAGLMLAAVAVMAAVRVVSDRPAASCSPHATPSTLPPACSEGPGLPASEGDDDESLASFVAAEFAAASPHVPPLRLRRTGAGLDAGAVSVGMAAVVLGASA